MAFRIFKRLSELLDVNTAGAADGDALTYDTATSKWIPGAGGGGGGGGGAPTTVDYLVGTANGTLSAEIVVGTAPGGELGGTWASPTVDATHSGSSHAAVQAAAEATAASALATHAADSTGIHGIADTSALETTAGAQAKVDTHVNDPTDAHAGTAITNTPAGTIAATTVQAAINELDSEKAASASAVMDGDAAGGVLSGTYPNPGFAADMATQAELDAHVSDTSAAHAASAISVDSTTLVGTGTDAQAVFEELDNGIADHLADTSDAHDASAISVADSGGYFTGTDVETALAEIGVWIPWTVVRKASDESVASSTTFQDDDELFFTAVSGAIYEFQIHIVYGSPAGAGTPDFKAHFGEDTTVRGVVHSMGQNEAEVIAVNSLFADRTAAITRGTAAADRSTYCWGIYWGAGGTFRVRWAQNTSNGNATIVRAGSVLRYRRIV